jgi:hypothetical protein
MNTDVVHGAPLANIVVMVDVLVEELNAPESNALIVVLPDTVVTEAEVG